MIHANNSGEARISAASTDKVRALRLAGVVGLVILGFGLLPFVSYRSATAMARVVTGIAEYKEGSGPWKPVKPGQELRGGVSLRTGLKSHVVLWLQENSCVLRLEEHSEVVLDRLAEGHGGKGGDSNRAMTSLFLQRGSIIVNARPVSNVSRLGIMTPNCLVIPQETQFAASLDAVAVAAGKLIISRRVRQPNGITIWRPTEYDHGQLISIPAPGSFSQISMSATPLHSARIKSIHHQVMALTVLSAPNLLQGTLYTQAKAEADLAAASVRAQLRTGLPVGDSLQQISKAIVPATSLALQASVDAAAAISLENSTRIMRDAAEAAIGKLKAPVTQVVMVAGAVGTATGIVGHKLGATPEQSGRAASEALAGMANEAGHGQEEIVHFIRSTAAIAASSAAGSTPAQAAGLAASLSRQ